MAGPIGQTFTQRLEAAGYDEDKHPQFAQLLKEYKCPISQEVMNDPVRDDKLLFDRASLAEWIRTQDQQNKVPENPLTKNKIVYIDFEKEIEPQLDGDRTANNTLENIVKLFEMTRKESLNNNFKKEIESTSPLKRIVAMFEKRIHANDKARIAPKVFEFEYREPPQVEIPVKLGALMQRHPRLGELVSGALTANNDFTSRWMDIGKRVDNSFKQSYFETEKRWRDPYNWSSGGSEWIFHKNSFIDWLDSKNYTIFNLIRDLRYTTFSPKNGERNADLLNEEMNRLYPNRDKDNILTFAKLIGNNPNKLGRILEVLNGVVEAGDLKVRVWAIVVHNAISKLQVQLPPCDHLKPLDDESAADFLSWVDAIHLEPGNAVDNLKDYSDAASDLLKTALWNGR